MTEPTTTFFAYHGTVVRLVDSPDALELDVWNRVEREWRPAPGLYGYVTGLGGDPVLDELSSDQARRIIEEGPGANLDGPDPVPDYANRRK